MSAEIVREGVIRLRTEIVEAKLPAPDIGPLTAALEKGNAVQQETLRLLTKQTSETDKAADETRRAEEAKRREIEKTNAEREKELESQRNYSESTIRIGESLKKAGDGAFTFARGLALTSLDGKESLEDVLLTIGKLQGQFDLFRGSLDVVAGGFEALTTANNIGLFARNAEEDFESLKSGFASVVGFLGPGGLIAVGATAAAAAVGLVYIALADSAETELDRAEKRLDEFIEKARRESFELENSLRKSSNLRSFAGQEERIGLLQGDLAGLAASETGQLAADQASFRERQQLQNRAVALQSQLRNAGTVSGPGGAPSQAAIDLVKRLSAELRGVEGDLKSAGGGVTSAESDKLLERAKQNEEITKSRQSLTDQIFLEQKQRNETSARSREAEINATKRERESVESKLGRTQEQLDRVKEEKAKQEEAKQVQFKNLNAGDRSRLGIGLGRLERGGNFTREGLEELRKIASLTAGPEIDAFKRRRAGLDAEDPNAESAGLRSEINALKSELAALRANQTEAVAADRLATTAADRNLAVTNAEGRAAAEALKVAADMRRELETLKKQQAAAAGGN